jgi:hypothetical protein
MSERSDAKRTLLRHFLAALAYRTQKALRGAPPSFASFDAGNKARAPKELLRHMTNHACLTASIGSTRSHGIADKQVMASASPITTAVTGASTVHSTAPIR